MVVKIKASVILERLKHIENNIAYYTDIPTAYADVTLYWAGGNDNVYIIEVRDTRLGFTPLERYIEKYEVLS